MCVVELNINGDKNPGEKSQVKTDLAKLREPEDAL